MARGADRSTAEDISHDVAIKAMDGAVGFHDLDDFCAWGCTVARNLYIDVLRNRGKFVEMDAVPERATAQDVGNEVEQRIVLDGVLNAILQLEPGDREAIVDGMNPAPTPSRKLAIRSAVRRHRARARLARLVEGLAALWAFLKGGRKLAQSSMPVVLVAGAFALAPAVLRAPSATEAFPPSRSPHEVTLGNRIDRQPEGRPAGAAGTTRVPRTSEVASGTTSPPKVRPPIKPPVEVKPEPEGHACILDKRPEDGGAQKDPDKCFLAKPTPPSLPGL